MIVTKPIQIRLAPDLVDLLDSEADNQDVPRNEMCARILAAYFSRPELAEIPRQVPKITHFRRPRKPR